MRFTDIRSRFQPPRSSLGAALLVLFFSSTGSVTGDSAGDRGRWGAALGRRTPVPHAWPPARRVWQS